MKADVQEIRQGYGEIRLFPESVDDIWHLSHLIAPGDLVFAQTFRSVETATDKLRPEKAEKRPVRIGIRVEKVEFHQYSSRLRVTGVIESGPDVGSYHTLNLEPSFEVSVIRFWSKSDRERVDRAVNSSGSGLVHVLAIEEGEAELFRIRQYGPEQVLTITMGSGKGAPVDSREGFFIEAAAPLLQITGPVIIAGPGFIKDDFARFLKNRYPAVAANAMVVETRRIGRGAVQEVIGQGVIGKIAGDLQLGREVQVMDEVLKRIAMEGLITYGKAEVGQAISFGAADQVIVSDRLIRDPEVARLMEQAEQMNATVTVLSSCFEPGERLWALGGIAALLRYAL
jgi:protein pelota